MSQLGTTTTAVVVFSFLLPVLGFALALVPEIREGRKSGLMMGRIIKGSILSWPTIVAASLTVFAWLGLFGWISVRTIYREHKALVATNIELGKKIDKAKEESSGKDSKISELSKKIDDLKGQKSSAPRAVISAPSPIFSDSDKIILAQSLTSGRGNTVTLYTIGGNEASAVYLQINEVFRKSGWTVQNAGGTAHLNLGVFSNGVMTTPKVEGLYLIAPKPDNAAVRTIVSSFELARHPVSLNGSDLLNPRGEITLYIAFGNQPR